ncbi:zinc-binding dehydrogenase [Novosphingobium panipatense]|uniref:NADPH2:quinone reductase n=2 Tax=Novosphingobium panipatense TaxID=428991 RepID=A0ABY1QUF5_9SPHN|nr:zinc-binding dehydrogenase [Novosphingobium panipatense]SMP81164.1 NADPH2:quinone reductase [Novosphingobium panipatense]
MSDVIRMHAVGGPAVLVAEQETLGSPAPGQVKIRQEAIGVNFLDTMFRSGTFGVSLPFVNGVEGAGEIIEVGSDVGGFQPGDRVAYFFAPGAYAQERIMDTAPLVTLPQDVPTQLAAGLLTKGVTAWLAVRRLHEVKAGDVVLVQGATGGVGSLVARWAKKLGAIVIAVGSTTKLERLPADIGHRLSSETPDLGSEIRALAPDGADVVYDFVGRATADATLKAVRDGGAIFTIGAASGPAAFDERLVTDRRIRVEHASAASAVKGGILEAAASEIFARWRDGTFGEIQLDRYALKDAAGAHQAIADRTIGPNPVLVP